MGKQSCAQTFCLLYLLVSGHILVSARRISHSSTSLVSKQRARAESVSNSTSKVKGHPWCNPLSSHGKRSYYFDVEYTDQKCEDGNCVAIEFVRQGETPLMKLHQGMAWKVDRDTDGDLKWEPYYPGPEPDELGEKAGEKVVMMAGPGNDVEAIKFYDADKENPDKLVIISSSAENRRSTGITQKEVLVIEGGLYYNEEIIHKGLKKLDAEVMKKLEANASKPTWSGTGRSKGKWIGGAGGAFSVVGMYTAATVTGVAVQTQALVGAALVGVIGGTIAGFVVGGIIGGVIGVGLIVAGYKKTKNGVTIKPAARKIYEKIRCMSKEFDECKGMKNVLVPKGKSCHGI